MKLHESWIRLHPQRQSSFDSERVDIVLDTVRGSGLKLFNGQWTVSAFWIDP